MAIAFLSTLAVQIGSACFNNFRSKKHAQDLARKQQAYEEKVVREGIENARSEFAELCAFQREMEIEMQKDRLNLIRANHENSLIQAAYENSLGSWPLMVPPYVIKNDTILSVNLQPEKAIPLNCILTTSSDNKFNKAVFYKLEEAIACFCSKYWNVSANKSIRFFQESWRDNFKDVGVKHKDLYAHLSDVPTLVISPVIKNGKLIFRFYWWGLSNDPMDAHLNDIANELDPEVNVAVEANHNYTKEEVATILSICEPRIEAFISFFADLYYFNFYKVAPYLPSLLSSHEIELNIEEVKDYNMAYSNCFDKFIQDKLQVKDLNNLIQGFAPSIEDKTTMSSNLLDYVKKLPEAKQSECIPALEALINLMDNKSEKTKISQFINSIDFIYSRQSTQPINWTIRQSDTLNILDVLSISLSALPQMPSCDTFHILKRSDRLAVIAYFSIGEKVVSWANNGIWVFQTKKFYCPTDFFGSTDRFSCKTTSLALVEQLIKRNMNNEDISAILDDQFEKLNKELLPLASKIDDLFKSYIDQVKAQIAQECGTKDVETINRHQVKYEDIVSWLRKAKEAMGTQRFDGAFIVKDKGGFFDKYPYKLYICLTLNKTPLTEANHPKCIISFESTDDTIDDMFGNNHNVQINFK